MGLITIVTSIIFINQIRLSRRIREVQRWIVIFDNLVDPDQTGDFYIKGGKK